MSLSSGRIVWHHEGRHSKVQHSRHFSRGRPISLNSSRSPANFGHVVLNICRCPDRMVCRPMPKPLLEAVTMLSIRLFVITAFGLVVAVAAQLSSQCQFVRFSPGFDSEDPISYTARCARVPDGPVEVCSELRLGHCFTNQDGSLGGAVEYADDVHCAKAVGGHC